MIKIDKLKAARKPNIKNVCKIKKNSGMGSNGSKIFKKPLRCKKLKSSNHKSTLPKSCSSKTKEELSNTITKNKNANNLGASTRLARKKMRKFAQKIKVREVIDVSGYSG